MLLLRAVVLTRARDVQSECVSIKLQARFRVTDDDRSVIDAEKQLVFLLPLRITFAGRELKNLEPMLVRIAKVKRLDAAGIFVPIGQSLWTSRSVFDFVRAQHCVSFVHVTRDDCNMLKPSIVAA